eukprot:2373405-Amphidinium_carterae.1
MEAPCAICMLIVVTRTCATTAMIFGDFPTCGNSLGAAWLIRGFPLIHPKQSRADGFRVRP